MASYTHVEFLYILSLIRFSLFVTTEIFFVVGVMTCVFIIAVNVIDWRNGRTTTTSDQVIISIMISRMILQSVVQLDLFWKKICVKCSSKYNLVIRIIYTSSMYFSIWLSTLLCVVFYLKILNFHSAFFLWLRKMFSKRITHFIIASLLVSFGQTSVIYIVYYTMQTHFSVLNSSRVYVREPIHETSVVFNFNMFCPLLIFVLSSLFLISSLYLHIRHMRCNGNMTSSLDVYYRIIKYTTGSIFTFLLSVIINVLSEKYYYMFGFELFSFPWGTFGTLHSILLIYATPKLKTPLSRILKCLYNYITKRKDPTDSVMTVTT